MYQGYQSKYYRSEFSGYSSRNPKRNKLSDGGGTYLFATILSNDQKVLIRCSKVSSNS